MVQNIIHINEREDRVLNIVKAKYGLRNKSQAVALIAKVYEEKFLEPQLRPEYMEKLGKIEKEKGIPFKRISELRKIIED
ncbi:MAG: DUF2683 family protein [Nanoarchaeota archaeon]|nr:DUF2683 family protein [Nanoarchaeota archaeon]